MTTDCPRPSLNMRHHGATWQRDCDCEGCTAGRESYDANPGRSPRDLYVDEMAVERALRGDAPAEMSRAERLEVTRKLTARGVPAAQIARILRASHRTVTRYRTELRMESA